MNRSFFYDTWAFVALADRRDPGHGVAVDLDRALERAGFVASTSDYVVDEAITLLHAAGGARASLAFLDALGERVMASELKLLEIGARRREKAIELFRRLGPSEPRLSFTDATSFAVMVELGVEFAFTADRHFHRAGGGIAPLVERRGSRLIARGVLGM